MSEFDNVVIKISENGTMNIEYSMDSDSSTLSDIQSPCENISLSLSDIQSPSETSSWIDWTQLSIPINPQNILYSSED